VIAELKLLYLVFVNSKLEHVFSQPPFLNSFKRPNRTYLPNTKIMRSQRSS